MNPATAQAHVIVDELVRCGLQEMVIAPGSWSTPLALASMEHPGIRIHVRIDERSAAFLALGLSKVSKRPVGLICTSGTAAANFYPALIEADHCGIPLIVLTADRPPEWRATGASQTIDQLKLFGSSVRFFWEVGIAEERVGSVAYWRSATSRAVARALDPTDSGPVHFNLCFRKPLIPDNSEHWPESLAGRANNAPWTRILNNCGSLIPLDAPARGVVVLGDSASQPDAALTFAQRAGWPVLAEPSSDGRHGENLISHASYLLRAENFVHKHQPEMVITVGRPTVSPELLTFCATAAQHVVVEPSVRWPDAGRSVTEVIPALDAIPTTVNPEPSWLASWQNADQRASQVLAAELANDAALSELAVARQVSLALASDGLLFVSSSMPIRDLDAVMAPTTARVVTNRGVAGIDGTISTAIGAALAHQRQGGGRALALIGDLAALHDHNGLIFGPEEPEANLSIVIVNNNGGGIFSLLPQADLEEPIFDRLFTTPHGVDFFHVAAATNTIYREAQTLPELRNLLATPGEGIQLIEVKIDQSENTKLRTYCEKRVIEKI